MDSKRWKNIKMLSIAILVFFFFELFIYFNILPAYMYVYHVSAFCSQSSEEAFESSRTGVTESRGLPCEYYEPNLFPWSGQH